MIIFKPLFIILGLITAATSVIGCSVQPTSAVVTVGERVDLTCTTYQGGTVTSWHIPINIRRRTTVYTALIYKSYGTVKPEEIAQGYLVIHPAGNETTLQMKRTVLSQAGLYVCTCNQRGTAASTVVVLDSEPTFSKNNSAANGEPVSFSCFISFNASSESDIACELKIANASGYTVVTGNDVRPTVNGGLTECSLQHTIIAIISSDLWHTCHVTLSAKNRGMIYSRVLNAVTVVQLGTEPVDTTSDFSLGADDAYQVLMYRITLGVACIIIAILTTTMVVLCNKPRQRRRTISTQDCPAQYSALDAQKALEERQREPYTELPIQFQQDQAR
jgi:hypothetical protein